MSQQPDRAARPSADRDAAVLLEPGLVALFSSPVRQRVFQALVEAGSGHPRTVDELAWIARLKRLQVVFALSLLLRAGAVRELEQDTGSERFEVAELVPRPLQGVIAGLSSEAIMALHARYAAAYLRFVRDEGRVTSYDIAKAFRVRADTAQHRLAVLTKAGLLVATSRFWGLHYDHELSSDGRALLDAADEEARGGR